MTARPAAGAPAARRSVRIAAWALCAALCVAAAETTLALLPRFAGDQLRSVIYLPPTVTRAEFEEYLARRDPVLGWPAPPSVAPRIAPRPSPASRAQLRPCVTLYGESFVFADEVEDDVAWGNVLAGALACPVGNFGVGGYGTDQALLRFIANEDDRAPVTVLGIFPENLLRNVNQYRHFLSGAEPLSLKPRFVVDAGGLRLVPMPSSSYDSFAAGLRDPGRLFLHETFLPDAPHGPTTWTFPFTASLVRLMLKQRVRNYVRGRPSWIDFFRADHDSHALPTTVAIAEELRRVAAARGKSILVVVFPSLTAYELSRRAGGSPYASLTTALEARGIVVRDLIADFAGHLGERSFCEILTQPSRCAGHYNAEGNRLVAAVVQRQLAAAGLVVADPSRR